MLLVIEGALAYFLNSSLGFSLMWSRHCRDYSFLTFRQWALALRCSCKCRDRSFLPVNRNQAYEQNQCRANLMFALRTKTGIKPMFENELDTFASDIGLQTIVVRRANMMFAYIGFGHWLDFGFCSRINNNFFGMSVRYLLCVVLSSACTQ